MKYRLTRPSAAVFPALLFAAALLGAGAQTRLFAAGYFTVQILSLCAAECFRNAAAREPGPRRMDRRFFGAVAQLIIGAALAIGATILFEGSGVFDTVLTAAGALMLFAQLCEERLFALSRPKDGALLAAVGSGLLFTGMMLDGSGGLNAPFYGCFTLAASAIAAVSSTLIAFVGTPPKGKAFAPVNYGFAPRAFLQTLFYPLLAAVLFVSVPMTDVAIFGGWILWRLARTVARRSADESRPMDLLFVAITAAALLAARLTDGTLLPIVGCVPLMTSAALSALLALLSADVIFLAPSLRLCAGTALCMAMPFLPAGTVGTVISAVCAVAAVAVNVHHAFLKRK